MRKWSVWIDSAAILPSGTLTKPATASSLQAPLIIYLPNHQHLVQQLESLEEKLAESAVLSAQDLVAPSKTCSAVAPPVSEAGFFFFSFFSYTFVLASQIFAKIWLKLDLIARPWFTNTQCGVVTLHIMAHKITGLSVFYSYTVLRKDVREINADCPPKADAGLKSGETTVFLSEVNVSGFLHSSPPAPNVCGLVCVMTKNMDQAAARHWRKGSFVFAPQNAAAVSACHCRVYFYLKSSPGFLYSAPIFPLQRPRLFYNYSFGNSSVQCQSWYSQVVDSQLWCFPVWPKKKKV